MGALAIFYRQLYEDKWSFMRDMADNYSNQADSLKNNSSRIKQLAAANKRNAKAANSIGTPKKIK